VTGGFALGTIFGNEGDIPEDHHQLLDLAAVGIAVVAWRNSPLEDCHQRISHGQMMRSNAASTRFVTDRLEELVESRIDRGSPGLSQDT